MRKGCYAQFGNAVTLAACFEECQLTGGAHNGAEAGFLMTICDLSVSAHLHAIELGSRVVPCEPPSPLHTNGSDDGSFAFRDSITIVNHLEQGTHFLGFFFIVGFILFLSF